MRDDLYQRLSRSMTRREWLAAYRRLRTARRRLSMARVVAGQVYVPGTAEVVGAPYFRPCAAIWPM
jgi:hypothetical protein